MAKKLDREKPYGLVQGDDLGRKFEQGGVHFDAAGEEWKPPKSDTQLAAEQDAVNKAAIDAAVKARLAELGLGPDGKPLPAK